MGLVGALKSCSKNNVWIVLSFSFQNLIFAIFRRLFFLELWYVVENKIEEVVICFPPQWGNALQIYSIQNFNFDKT